MKRIRLALSLIAISFFGMEPAIAAEKVDRIEYETSAECFQNGVSTPQTKCTPTKLKSLRQEALAQARFTCAHLFGRPGMTTILKDLGNQAGPISKLHSSIVRTLKVACQTDYLDAKLSIPHLISVMGEDNAANRFDPTPSYAQKALVQLGIDAEPALLKALGDKNQRIRELTIGAFESLAQNPKFSKRVPAYAAAIAPLLADNAGNGLLFEQSVSLSARSFFEQVKTVEAATLKVMLKIIENDRVELIPRSNSIMVITNYVATMDDSQKKDLIVALVDALRAKGPDETDLESLLSAAQHALADLGPVAQSTLVDLLDNEPHASQVRIRAGLALAGMGWKAGVVGLPAEVLTRLFDVPDSEVRYEAAVMVSGIVFKNGAGALGKSLPLIVKGLEDTALKFQERVPSSSANPAEAAVQALGDLGTSAKNAKSTLIKVINEDPAGKETLVVEAALSIGRILGKDGADALPRLEALRVIFKDNSILTAHLNEAIGLVKGIKPE